MTSEVDLPFDIVPFTDLFQPDGVDAGAPIWDLFGAYVALGTTLSADSNFEFTIEVIRANSVVGGGPAFGWLSTGNGGAGTPDLDGFTPVSMPPIPSNTALVGDGAGNFYLPLLPGDILIVETQSDTSTSLTAGLLRTVIR